jgi:hypothetical protein
MPKPETDSTIVSFRYVSQEFRERVSIGGVLRELWRPARSGLLLDA